MQYKTILFDLDGTLTDSAPGILNSVRYGCRRIGIPVPDEATLRRFLGPPLIDSFHNLCGLNDADTDRAVAAFREYFPDKGLFENEVYPGIPALLADLHARGCQLVLATSKPEEYARRIMEQTRRESESIIADLKRMKKEQQNPDAQVNAIRRRIENNVDNLSEGLLQKVDTGLPPKEVRKGDTVEILTIGSQGTVLAPANAKGEVEVQAGILKLKVNISQLRLVKQPDKPKPQPTSVHLKTGAMERTVRMECDVRGMALDEAIMTVDQYLDQAILAGMGEVSIIHGKGTGVLRSGIQQHLKHHMHVASCRLGVYGEGESGVTIVTLK